MSSRTPVTSFHSEPFQITISSSSRPQDIDYNVPPEYLINVSIRDKLSKLTLQKYKDDLLFYLFYTNVGDVMQLAAAAEL